MEKNRSGSNKRKRQNQLLIRLTDAERVQLNLDADRVGTTTASYARQVLIDAPIPKQSKRPTVETELLRKTLAELNKIGSNINQLAHSHNLGLSPHHHTVEAELEILNDAITQVLIALGKIPANDN
ncbi:MAG: plasmid mobilization relaxosome protein MobC [Cyanobacteria bacterium J06623_1]